MNHCELVLNRLKKRRGKGITQKDMLKVGVFRLAARISDLRDRGFVIATQFEHGTNQYGHAVRYARYVLL